MRAYIKEKANAFAKDNTHLQVQVQTFAGKHPLLIGQYVNDNEKVVPVQNKSAEEISESVMFLRNQSGRPVHSVGKNQIRVVKSLQGEWHPEMEWPEEFNMSHSSS